MCHPCDPGHSGRSLYRSSAIALCVGRSSKFVSISSHRTAHSFNTRAEGRCGQLRWRPPEKRNNMTGTIRFINGGKLAQSMKTQKIFPVAARPLFACLYRFLSGSDRETENLGFPFAVLLKSTFSCHCCSGNRMQIKPSVTRHPKPQKPALPGPTSASVPRRHWVGKGRNCIHLFTAQKSGKI